MLMLGPNDDDHGMLIGDLGKENSIGGTNAIIFHDKTIRTKTSDDGIDQLT